ncbi:hypothetical protein BLA29_003243 [Euroglyphus maynei]|uniref:Uncharacterized protein n=1 Tax=Euroglyphus maynei TaxID=6958 RepID=A0A1Y3BNB5_EURMA|nr:hypothetical protein BLA29_003243 [Euroglyphus maynei]
MSKKFDKKDWRIFYYVVRPTTKRYPRDIHIVDIFNSGFEYLKYFTFRIDYSLYDYGHHNIQFNYDAIKNIIRKSILIFMF